MCPECTIRVISWKYPDIFLESVRRTAWLLPRQMSAECQAYSLVMFHPGSCHSDEGSICSVPSTVLPRLSVAVSGWCSRFQPSTWLLQGEGGISRRPSEGTHPPPMLIYTKIGLIQLILGPLSGRRGIPVPDGLTLPWSCL